MQNVVTLVEIRKFEGMKEAVLPAGSIVTPAARDWAREHRIELVWEDGEGKTQEIPEHEAWLRGIIGKIAAEFARQERPADKEDLAEAVWRCLEKLGAAKH